MTPSQWSVLRLSGTRRRSLKLPLLSPEWRCWTAACRLTLLVMRYWQLKKNLKLKNFIVLYPLWHNRNSIRLHQLLAYTLFWSIVRFDRDYSLKSLAQKIRLLQSCCSTWRAWKVASKESWNVSKCVNWAWHQITEFHFGITSICETWKSSRASRGLERVCRWP